MIIVSACLAGINCKYDGGNNLVPEIRDLVAEGRAVPVCPEQLGGCPTPRVPVELVGVSGEDVLDGKGRAVDESGCDKSESFVKGAEETLKLARVVRADMAVLKERSPSCGSKFISGGSFTRRPRRGCGITAALLMRNGIKVISEEDIDLIRIRRNETKRD